MTLTRSLGIVMAATLAGQAAAAETLTWEATALLLPGRSPAGQGVKDYSAKDIVVRERRADDGTLSWTKWLLLDESFSIGVEVQRAAGLDGFGLVVFRRGDQDGFSWDWFDRAAGGTFAKRQGGGRVKVSMKQVGALEEIASIEFVEDTVLRYLDDMSKPPGTVTHEILVKKGSVLRIAP